MQGTKPVLVQDWHRLILALPSMQRIHTRMPTKRKLCRHCIIPTIEIDKDRTHWETTKPQLHHPHNTPVHSSTTLASSCSFHWRPWMVHQTLRYSARETNWQQTRSTKNTTSHRSHHTHIHKPENNTDKAGYYPATREHSNGGVHTPWTSYQHTNIHILATIPVKNRGLGYSQPKRSALGVFADPISRTIHYALKGLQIGSGPDLHYKLASIPIRNPDTIHSAQQQSLEGHRKNNQHHQQHNPKRRNRKKGNRHLLQTPNTMTLLPSHDHPRTNHTIINDPDQH